MCSTPSPTRSVHVLWGQSPIKGLEFEGLVSKSGQVYSTFPCSESQRYLPFQQRCSSRLGFGRSFQVLFKGCGKYREILVHSRKEFQWFVDSLNCHRWAQVTEFLVIADKELNRTHREFIADLLSDSTLHRTWEQANSAQQRLTSGAGSSYRVDPSWVVLAGFYCTRTSSCITLKLLCMWSPMIFLDWPLGKGITQC